MKKIGLIDIDSKIPNLALMKLSAYYKKLGYQTELSWPLFYQNYEKVFASKIFTYSDLPNFPDYVEIGGSAISLKNNLPDEIENIMPDYELYPNVIYSMGFTTRGCIRKCPFCIVPQKEGQIRIVAEIKDFWNKKHRNIMIFDNNILALPKHFFKIADQLKKYKLKVDFNQGLDHRLLNNKICKTLSSISHFEYRFAFDSVRFENSVIRAIEMLKKAGLKRNFWYVLVGFDTSLEEDIYRLKLLRKYRQTVYVQRYNFKDDRALLLLTQWANQHHLFYHYTWEKFINHPEKIKYKHLFE